MSRGLDPSARFAAGRRLLSEVTQRPLDWLWPGYIPAGSLTLLEGDPGVGKSTVALDIAARVSTGRPMPGEDARATREPAGVVLLCNEDEVETTIIPRLTALGADLSRIVIRDFAHDERFNEREPSIDDLDALRDDIATVGARLAVFDPLKDFLPPGANANDEIQVREALRPFLRMCQEMGVSAIGIRHLRKQATGNAMHAGGGSIAFSARARAVLLFVRERGSGSPETLLLVPAKSNLSGPGRAQRYVIEAAGETSVVRWLGAVEATAEALLDGGEERFARRALDEAVEFLRLELADGPKQARDIEAAARGAALAMPTVRRAKAELGVVSFRVGMTGAWWWKLAEDDQGRRR